MLKLNFILSSLLVILSFSGIASANPPPLRDGHGNLSPKQIQFCAQAEPNEGAFTVNVNGAAMFFFQADSAGHFTCVGSMTATGIDLDCKEIDPGVQMQARVVTNANGLGTATFVEPP